jgi:L-alanine-DL-glutamate epimerase-like enolase superfamily enzyme
MLRRLEEFDLVWVEEPVLPHDHEGYVHVRQRVSMPISGGEFEYDRHAFQRWAQMGCADIWQPDANAFFWHVMKGEPVATEGYLELPESPGLGLSLDPEAMARYTVDI